MRRRQVSVFVAVLSFLETAIAKRGHEACQETLPDLFARSQHCPATETDIRDAAQCWIAGVATFSHRTCSHDANGFLDASDWIFSRQGLNASHTLARKMRSYTLKEKAKITAGAVTALVIVAWFAIVALALLSGG